LGLAQAYLLTVSKFRELVKPPFLPMPQRKTPKKTPNSNSARRRRLPADQARGRILAAAERKLAELGPEQLRLTELAAELGITHQAILHHFGSREELVSAVLAQAIARINQRWPRP